MAGAAAFVARNAPAAAAGVIVLVLGATARLRLTTRSRRPAPPDARPPTRWRRRGSVRRLGPLAAAAALVVVAGWFIATVVVAAVAAGRTARPVRAERRRRRAAHRDFPDAVDRIVLLVHAGLTPHLAVREASSASPPSIAPAFDEVVHRVERGLPLGEALAALPELLGPHAATLADAFAAADRYGLPLEPMLDQLAGDARAARRRLDEGDARRLSVRMTFPLVTCTLPGFVLVAIAPAVIAALSSLGGAW